MKSNKYQSEICKAMFYNNLSQDALQWPVLEILYGGATRGSGEFTTFGSKMLVRVNGKQRFREVSFGCHLPDLDLTVAEVAREYNATAIQVHIAVKSTKLFVLKPKTDYP